MLNFISSLTPEQLALFAGVLAPFAHYATTKYTYYDSKYKSQLNWLLSFAFPALFLVADYLYKDPGFNHAIPLYATIYTTGQAIYILAVSKYSTIKDLQAQLAPPVAPVVTTEAAQPTETVI